MCGILLVATYAAARMVSAESAAQYGSDSEKTAGDYSGRVESAIEALRSGAIDSVNGIAFSEDFHTVYATHWSNPAGGRMAKLVSYQIKDCGVQFSGSVFPNSQFSDYQPKLSPDGNFLFFTSTRPIGVSNEAARQNVWFSRRTEGSDRWSEPQLAEAIASSYWDEHAILTRTNNIYFASERPGGMAMVDIYRARWNAGSVGRIENVAELNSMSSDHDFHLDAEERYIILSRYDDATKDINLYYSLRSSGAWAQPEALDIANTEQWELSPVVDPTRRYLLFKRADAPGFVAEEVDRLPPGLANAISRPMK